MEDEESRLMNASGNELSIHMTWVRSRVLQNLLKSLRKNDTIVQSICQVSGLTSARL